MYLSIMEVFDTLEASASLEMDMLEVTPTKYSAESVTTGRNDLFNISLCNYTENPWCGMFGTQQIFEVIYLTILTICGIFGNLLVIFSILLEKKLHKQANIFIVNLAFADFLAAGLYTPLVIANVFASGLGYSVLVCQIFAFVIIVACSSSMWNLAFISFNRYVAITSRKWFSKIFSINKSYLIIIFIWAWSCVIATPPIFGWSALRYDPKSMVCTWDDRFSISYSLFLIFSAILLPLLGTIFFYWKLFWNVRTRSRSSRRILTNREDRVNVKVRRVTIKREVNLLKTLATAVIVFVLCWTPYTFCVLINPDGVNPLVKKICTWLGLQNSAVNFIIYGVMNQGYRNGYKKLFYYITCRQSNSWRQNSRPESVTSFSRTVINSIIFPTESSRQKASKSSWLLKIFTECKKKPIQPTR